MRWNATSDRTKSTSTIETAAATAARTVQTEDIHLRNYDPYQEYDLSVTVTDSDGRTVLKERYYFQPG